MPKNEAVVEVALQAACIRAAAGWYGAGPNTINYTMADARRLYELATSEPWKRGDGE